MSIGSKIKTVRESRGISQLELAEYLGMTQKAVSAWECDRSSPRMRFLLKIAYYFNVPVSSFLEDEITADSLLREIMALTPEKREKAHSYIMFLNQEK